MLVRVPDYFDQFACLAGDCPHSCCIGWEVVIDEDTAWRYRAEPGPLGESSGPPCSLTARTSAFRWTAAAAHF